MRMLVTILFVCQKISCIGDLMLMMLGHVM